MNNTHMMAKGKSSENEPESIRGDNDQSHVKIQCNDNNSQNKKQDAEQDAELLKQANTRSNRRVSNNGGTGLTLKQKKENHIMSENRRRAQIRSTFDRLVELVPQLDASESRSELAILAKTSNYIEHLRSENKRLEKIQKERGL
jgi:heteromeric Ino2p/Ino4p transcription factor